MKTRRELLFTAPAAALAGGRTVLARGGRSSYSIHLPEDAIPSERRAAAELQRFLEEMSGARLPITTAPPREAIRLQASGAGPEEFTLRTAGRDLLIAGGRPRGVLYGVSTLLEKLGCRWFTAEVSRIPRRKTLIVPAMEETHRPAFEYREVFFTEAWDKDWAARNRTNGGHSELDESTGGKVQYYPFVHSFYELVSPQKYFAAHPEYFSLVAGRRRAERAQLCLSNPEVLRIGVESVLRWIAQHPQASILSVSQNDWEGWCECDACRRIELEEGGAHSGPILRFVNAIAAEIDKQAPGKLIDTLAYMYSEDPPEKARPRPNVRIRLCPIGACQGHPYERCPHNAGIVRNLRAWSKITSQLYIWHYVTNFANYVLPYPDFDELAADLPMYRRHGVVGIFLEGAYAKGGGGENAELRSYVLAKLLWDTATDVNRAVNEFLEGVYGRAALPLRAYFELMHRQVRQGQHIWTYRSPRLSADTLAAARWQFSRAEARAADAATRGRVRQARLGIEYAELLARRSFSLREGAWTPADLAGLADAFQSFLARARGFGVTSLHEGRQLEDDEREFAALMKPWPAVVLEDERVRATVVPGLGGRVVSLVEKSGGKEGVRRAEPEERGYPDLGGITLGAQPDSQARTSWRIAWQAASSAARELVLAGACDNGLSLRRRLWVEDGLLRTQTVAQNGAREPLQAALVARAEFQAPEAALAFVNAAGEDMRAQLLPPGERASGQANYAGAARPAGEWRLEGRAVTLRNRFLTDEVERCTVSWRARGEDRVILNLWSNARLLGPGEQLRMNADYRVVGTTPL